MEEDAEIYTTQRGSLGPLRFGGTPALCYRTAVLYRSSSGRTSFLHLLGPEEDRVEGTKCPSSGKDLAFTRTSSMLPLFSFVFKGWLER